MPSDPADMMEAVFRTITQPLLVLDGDFRVAKANPAFLQAFEVGEEETTGTLVYDLGNGQWDFPALRRLLEEVLREEAKVEEYRVEHEFEHIGTRVMLLNAHRMGRGDAPDKVLIAIADVTERERLLHELEGRKEFSEKLIDSVRESLLILGWDLRVHSANQTFYDTFRIRREDAEGRMVYELGNGQWDIPELRSLLEDILPKETNFDDFEVDHEFDELGRRVMLLNGRRLDHLDLIVLAIRDVTERRERERRQDTLMGELHHRVKNILSNVRTLAAQTRRNSDTLDGFFDSFEDRLGALTRAQDLLMNSPEEEVSLGDVIRLELEAVGAESGRDFTAEGPLICLPPRDAQAIGMVMHELTTNAAKYGALKSEEGRIEIEWRTEARDDQGLVCLTWRERGVEMADAKPSKGFGSQVIEESLPYMLGGASSLVFHPDGAECRIEFPSPD